MSEKQYDNGLREAICDVDGANCGRKAYFEKNIPIRIMRDLSKLQGIAMNFSDSEDQYEELYRSYAKIVPVWEFVEPDRERGTMENLPNPVEDPMVFERISVEELMWVSGQIWGGAENPTTSGKPPSTTTTGE